MDPTVKEIIKIDEQLEQMNIEKTRTSLDKHRLNKYGQYMLEFCIANNILIWNGRTGEDLHKGSITCTTGNSTIYVLLICGEMSQNCVRRNMIQCCQMCIVH